MYAAVPVNASVKYDVLIGDGLLNDAGRIARDVVSASKAAVITDRTVASLYAAPVRRGFEDAGFDVCVHAMPDGETSKSLTRLEQILEFLTERRIGRGDVVIALGGGVVGDIAGFAAGVYMRGVDYIQIPTTLLAAVDSSVGGKVAANLKQGKNLAGLFYQPRLTICDCDVLRVLPRPVFANGLSEVVKYGVIADGAILDCLEEGETLRDLPWLVRRCVEIKRDVVQLDERDTGARQTLNFGHTVGHALERHSGYTLPHGQAVAMGMVCETRMATALGICEEGLSQRVIALLRGNDLPTDLPCGPDELIESMRLDKKNASGRIAFVMPVFAGDCRVRQMEESDVRDVLVRVCA
jgi:3-dehydroquinate synthase